MDAQDQIDKFKEFIDSHYKDHLYEIIPRGKKSLVIDFTDLARDEVELANALLEEPEESIRAAELALEHIDLPADHPVRHVRFSKLPDVQRTKISNVRSDHLGKFLMIEGIVRQASDVRPQVTSAKFECAGCGNTITILQIDTKFKEPTRCTCGWRGKFRMIGKDLIDVQHLKIEESPESLEGGEQPKRLSIFLKEDLVEPKMEKKTSPGSRVYIYGIVKEVPIQLKTGAQSVRYDLIMEANNVEAVQEDFTEIHLSKEDEDEIIALAKDPSIFEKLTRSIAPSIYGHEKIKEALVLQLMGGVRKTKPDGIITRGDIHILCVGDPGCIAGDSQVAHFRKGMDEIKNFGTTHMQPIKEAVTAIRKSPNEKPYAFATVFQKYPQQPVLKIITETGKEVICTYNQPFLSKQGWKRADELSLGTKIRVMPKIPNYVKTLVPTNFSYLPQTSGRFKDITLPKYLTEELAALYGYILGDGHIHKDGYSTTCYVNNQETDLIGQLSTFWKNVFSITPRIFSTIETPQPRTIDNGNGLLRTFMSTQEMHHLEINSRQITHALSFLAIKRVPQQLFQSQKQVIASFLRWLFEADGCVFGKGRGRTAIQLKSVRPGLLRDVQLLLLYFGIHSRIIEDNLCIRRSHDMELYAHAIGFASLKKKERLHQTLSVIQTKSQKQKRKKYQRWEEIKAVIPSGMRDVYDFEVPIQHSFIANGILCHNSGKSQILQFMSKAAPKARFVSGKGASGAGLCIAPDSLVVTNPGSIHTIKDIVEENLQQHAQPYRSGVWNSTHPHSDKKIFTLDDQLKVRPKEIDQLWRITPPEYMVKLRTQSGKEVIVTPNTKIYTSGLEWKEASVFAIGDYLATTRSLHFQAHQEKICTLPFLTSNPVVLHIKDKVRFLIAEACKKHTINKRTLAKHLGFSELSIYHNWINSRARGNIRLTSLKLLATYADVPLERIFDEAATLSLYNGHPITFPMYLTEDLLYFAGLIAGDGDLSQNRKSVSIRLSNSCPALIQSFQSSSKILFNIQPYLSNETSLQRPEAWRFCSKLVFELLNALGLPLSPKSHKIDMSNTLLKLPNSLLAHYLRGYFDTDGGGVERTKKGSHYVESSSTSKIFSEKLKLVLLRYNIHSKILEKKPRPTNKINSKYNKQYIIIRGKENLERFRAHIGFSHPEKRAKLDRIIAKVSRPNTNIDIIPEARQLLQLLEKEFNIHILQNRSDNNSISRNYLAQILPTLDTYSHPVLEKLRLMASSDLFWDKITNIENIYDHGYDFVYDLTVADSHNFIVNGVLVHNTAAVVKDEFLKGWALEAGALVLANKGLCVVDELDKIDKEDTAALHSAMEQQIIPISKANIQACYSDDTEVLTEAGWRKYSDVGHAKIAQYNSKDKTISFLPHKGLFVYDYKGLMYHFKNKRNDILVTPNHKMLFKEDRHTNYSFTEAQYLNYKRFKFLNSGSFIGEGRNYFLLPPIQHKQNRTHPKYTHQHSPKKIPIDLWLEFLGYYLSEGGLENRPTFGINQKTGKKATKIKNCLTNLSKYIGFTLTELKDGSYWRYQITNTQLCTYLETTFGDHSFNKKLVIDFSQFSKRQLTILYDALMLGDGASSGKSYGSTSLDLTDNFQALACLIGMSASNNLHYDKDYRKNRRKMYRVTLSKKTELSLTRTSIKKSPYNGKVYCFSTETGFFVTRRNGKIAIQGNTLTAQTTLLAAANPKLGRFDPYTPIASQIDLPSTLINRFDLIFPVRDIPEVEKDTRIALHVLEISSTAEAYKSDVNVKTLRRYVSYAKRINPTLSKDAVHEIKKFYVDLRNSGREQDGVKPIPISARQLEGLIRLAEASARVRLDTTITKEDARRAIELLKYCLMQVGFDQETGQIDIDRISTGISASTRSKIVSVKEILIALENRGQKTIPIEDVIAEAAKKGIEEHKVEEAIEQLKKAGDIFQPKGGYIQRI